MPFSRRWTRPATGLWAKTFASSGPITLGGGPNGIAVDGAGGPIITGNLTTGSVDFGGGKLTGYGPTAVSVASFDATGHYRWAYADLPSSTAYAGPTGVAANGDRVVVVGTFGGGPCEPSVTDCNVSPPGTTLVFPGKTLDAVTGNDMFMASFVP